MKGGERQKWKWEIIKIGSDGWMGEGGELDEKGESEIEEKIGDERDERQRGNKSRTGG